MTNKKTQLGVTLVELMIVVAVIGIVATLVATNFNSRQQTTVIQRTQKIDALAAALESYRFLNDRFPEYEQLRDPNWFRDNFKSVKAEDYYDEYGNFISQNPGSSTIEYYPADEKPTGTPPGPTDCGEPPKPYLCNYFKLSTGYDKDGTWTVYNKESVNRN